MGFIIREIPLLLQEDESELKKKAAKRAGIAKEAIQELRVVRESLDARKKEEICFRYTVEITIEDPVVRRKIIAKGFEETQELSEEKIVRGEQPVLGRVVVVGAGPCGLFCAYELARHGMRPILLERGKPVEQRSRDFETLCREGILNPESNVCFGEGGAGAFSDGKLTTRIKDRRTRRVLETLVACGAPEEILVQAKPHMGTEYIRRAVKRLRERLIALGGEVRFETKLLGLRYRNRELTGAICETGGSQETIETNCMVLAIGHSARDTFEMLHGDKIAMQPKPFAIGLRVEHPREWIDKVQYGKFAGHPRLGTAEYRLSTKDGKRGVYTFCMCPGGQVVCSATEEGHLAINGMSYYARKGENSNSAVVVSVSPEDFGGNVLSGVEFQRKYEALAFGIAEGYGAPVQQLGDFLRGEASKTIGGVQPSYRPYTIPANLKTCLPEAVNHGLSCGFQAFGKMFRGFDHGEALLTGIETRTSSPVRILRDQTLQSISLKGCYPAGEGAGYAGGIVSAAVDGLKVAREILIQFGGGET